ncbi:4244_t:CDS:2, partial [Dentiscutata heterogama]
MKFRFKDLVKQEQNLLQPSFICTYNNQTTKITNTPSEAINTLYRQIYNENTQYSGLAIIGFNNPWIVQKLLEGIEFISHFIKVDSFLIVISNIGINALNNFKTNFTSSLLTKLESNRCFVLQQLTEHGASLDFYTKDQLKKHFEDEIPTMVWKKTRILKKYNGNMLFGLENTMIQQAMQNKSIFDNITCSPDNCTIFVVRRRRGGGERIGGARQNIAGTCLANLEPNRDQEVSNLSDKIDEENNNKKHTPPAKKMSNKKAKVKMIPGISKYYLRQWPIKGPTAGYILAQQCLSLTSDHTTPTSKWTIPIPSLLPLEDNDVDMLDAIDLGSTDLSEEYIAENKDKGGGKRMSENVKELLECLFLNGNLKISDQMTAQDMHDALDKFVESGEINEEDISK